jgi:hypothetical protein
VRWALCQKKTGHGHTGRASASKQRIEEAQAANPNMTPRLRGSRPATCFAIAIAVAGCAAQPPTKRSDPTMLENSQRNVTNVRENASVPSPTAFTGAPLRNRIRIELQASVAEVWALVGNLERYPEYSAGLERVEVTREANGRCTGYVCYFRPQEEAGGSMSHREIVRWFEPNRGYASMAEEPNVFGLANSLTLVTLEESDRGTILTWSQHFDSNDAPAHKAIFEQALADISERLTARFGGRVVENYVERAHAESK